MSIHERKRAASITVTETSCGFVDGVARGAQAHGVASFGIDNIMTTYYIMFVSCVLSLSIPPATFYPSSFKMRNLTKGQSVAQSTRREKRTSVDDTDGQNVQYFGQFEILKFKMPVYPSADKLPLCVQRRNEGIGSAVIIHFITRRVHRPELVTPWAVPEGIGTAVVSCVCFSTSRIKLIQHAVFDTNTIMQVRTSQ